MRHSTSKVPLLKVPLPSSASMAWICTEVVSLTVLPAAGLRISTLGTVGSVAELRSRTRKPSLSKV